MNSCSVVVLILLGQKQNQKISNQDFKYKKAIYRDESRFAMVNQIAKMRNWNSARIEERAHILALDACKVWPIDV